MPLNLVIKRSWVQIPLAARLIALIHFPTFLRSVGKVSLKGTFLKCGVKVISKNSFACEEKGSKSKTELVLKIK